MILVDSSTWIDYLRGTSTPQTDTLDSLLGSVPLAIGDLILAEVLQGISDERQFQQTRELLGTLTIVDLAGYQIAIRAAMHFRALRKVGLTVRKTIDLIIATRCIQDDYELLHNDRDFDPFVKHLGLRSVL